MTRQHPVHDAVQALTRQQRMTIDITPAVRYRVSAPCLLQQLAEELGASSAGSGGRTIPSSRLLLASDAWDLWREIVTNTHGWAHELDLDRRPYLPTPAEPRPAADRPERQTQPPPWWSLLDPDAADVVHTVPGSAPADPPPSREQIPDPDRIHELPPVGRLLRLVAATATGRGLDQVADAIHHAAQRWTAQIEAMLHGQIEQRGVRGAECPNCWASSILEDRDDGRYRIPALVLVTRDVAGEQLQWIACQACGWSRGAGELLEATARTWLKTVADLWQRWYRHRHPRIGQETSA